MIRLFARRAALAAVLLAGAGLAPAAAQDCDAIEAEITRISVRSTSIAETTYRNTGVTVRNTGETTWTRGHNIRLIFGYGTSLSNLDDEFSWEVGLDRDVKPRNTHEFRFDFQTPIDTRRYDLRAYLMCGRESRPIAEEDARVNVTASYTVAGIVPRVSTLTPRSETGLTFGFKNTGRNTLPEGEAWTLRVTVASSPSASSAAEDVFEFTETLDGKGNPIGAGQELTANLAIDEVPEDDGRWRLRLELLRGGQRFRARGNPAYYDFTIEDPTLAAYFDIDDFPDELEAGDDGTLRLTVVNTGNGTLQRGDWEIQLDAEPPRDSRWSAWGDEMTGTSDLLPGDEEDVSFDFAIPRAVSGDDHPWGTWQFTVKLAHGSQVLDEQHFQVEVQPE